MSATVEELTVAGGLWVGQAAASSAALNEATAAAVGTSWTTFAAWYETARVVEQATEMAALSQSAQQAATGMFTEYVAQLHAALTEARRIEVPRIGQPRIRNGADLVKVHSRPAWVYRETFALTLNRDEALRRAIARAQQIVETDLMLASRQVQQDAMKALGVTRYRRVLRPELSEQGPCGLCVVASDRVYRILELLPIHGRCRCITMPVIGEIDPGRSLNRDDLNRLYKAAGNSTSSEDLKRLRVQVRQHGELGPVLVVRDQKFTGPDDLDDTGPRPGNAEIMQTLLTNLNTLMDMSRSGDDVEQAIGYQRALIARKRRNAA